MPSTRTARGNRIALGIALGVGAVVILLLAYFAAFHGWLTAVPASDPAATERVHASHAATANRLLIALGLIIIAESVGVISLIRRGNTRQHNAPRARARAHRILSRPRPPLVREYEGRRAPLAPPRHLSALRAAELSPFRHFAGVPQSVG